MDSKWANFNLGPIPKDQWQEFVFHIIHPEPNDGKVEVWQNGRQVVRHLGQNMEMGSKLFKWKKGIFKFTWDDTATRGDKRIIYFDNVKLGNEFENFEIMSSPKSD